MGFRLILRETRLGLDISLGLWYNIFVICNLMGELTRIACQVLTHRYVTQRGRR